MSFRLQIIGGGNMGEALLRGLLKNNWSSEDSDGGPSTAGIISNGSSIDGHQLDLNINNNGDKKLSLWWADNSTPGSPNMQSSFLDYQIIDYNEWYNILRAPVF